LRNKLRILFLLSACCWLGGPSLSATPAETTESLWEEEMSLGLDSTDTPKVKRLPDPKKSLLYSLILPGAGQVYNGRWWKVPFVYGALGATVGVYLYNQENYKNFQLAYSARLAGDPVPSGLPPEFSNPVLQELRTLRVYRDRYNKDRQSWLIYSIGVYGLQAIEALVDAHLRDFDVNEDLSLRLKPSLGMPGPGGMTPGVSLTLTIR
jgi:hypothetical protein